MSTKGRTIRIDKNDFSKYRIPVARPTEEHNSKRGKNSYRRKDKKNRKFIDEYDE